MTDDDTLAKAITIREPWCSAIADGHKPIENRRLGFPSHWRGIVLLHSSQRWSNRGLMDERIQGAYPGDRMPAMLDTAREGMGCVIGHAELVDVHVDNGCCRPWGETEYTEDDGTVRTRVAHLIFETPRRYATPIPARGALGLWTPSLDVQAQCAMEWLR